MQSCPPAILRLRRHNIASRPRRAPLLIGVLTTLALSVGCSRKSDVALLQPFAPPGQRLLKFTGDTAFERRSDGVRTLLLAFPLPGSKDGPRDFLIFIAAPDRAGVIPVSPIAGVGSTESSAGDGVPAGSAATSINAAGGFLIQTVGKRAGKAVFTDGTIRIHRDAAALGAERIDLDINCDDGTHITGRAYPRSASHELLIFERRYRADIAAVLTPSPAPVADAGAAPTPAAADGTPQLVGDAQPEINERSSQ